MSSQASELRERKIGITPFDCPCDKLLEKASASNFENLYELSELYHEWYSQALPVVRQLSPERYEEFKAFYRDARRKEFNWGSFTISDYFGGYIPAGGAENVPHVMAFVRLRDQVNILKGVRPRLDNAITDIEGTLQAQLFDNELSAALDLGKKGHLRAAGTVAGVVLERHLVKVAMDHGLGVRKANPTITI